jgi:hypothetical protein
VPRSSDPLRRAAFASLLPLLTLLAGCPPTCQQLCGKLNRCETDPLVTIDECRLSCERELESYTTLAKEEDDREPLKAFNQHRLCLGNHSCDEIADGVCYDEALFLFELQ